MTAETSDRIAKLAAKALDNPLSLAPDEIRAVAASALRQAEVEQAAAPLYAWFGWPAYDESGGWHDHRATTESLDEAKAAATAYAKADGSNIAHVVDLRSGEIVFDPDDEPLDPQPNKS